MGAKATHPVLDPRKKDIMSDSILLQATFLVVLTIAVFVLVGAFYSDDPHSRTDVDQRWRRRY